MLGRISAASARTQCLKLAARLPVRKRTKMDVSIPKRGVMRLVAEGVDISVVRRTVAHGAVAGQLWPDGGKTLL